MIVIPNTILKKIDKLLFDYLWDNKPAKIKQSTIIAPIKQGELGMIDVFEVTQQPNVAGLSVYMTTLKENGKLFSYNFLI